MVACRSMIILSELSRCIMAILVVSLIVAGCESQSSKEQIPDGGFEVFRVVCSAVPKVDAGNNCVVEQGSSCLSQPRLNLRVAKSYVSSLKLESQLAAAGTGEPRDPNSISVREVEVSLHHPAGVLFTFPGLANPFSLVASGHVPPADIGMTVVELIPAQYVSALRQLEPDMRPNELIASVKVRGVADDSRQFETPAFFLPIEILDTSPIESDKQCDKLDHNSCASLLGADAQARACLCSVVVNGDEDHDCSVD